MTQPEGQTQVITRAQSISLIRCLFRLVKCKFTEPLYKSAWYTLLSLLIFSTYALSIKREGRNLTKKKKKKEISRLLRLLHSSAVMLVNSAVLQYCGYRDSPSDINGSTVILWSYKNTLCAKKTKITTFFINFFSSVSVFDACSRQYHYALMRRGTLVDAFRFTISSQISGLERHEGE